MADADDLDLMSRGKQAGDGLGEGLNGTCGSLLYQHIAADALFKGKQHQIHRLLQRHDEPSHGGLRNGDGISCTNLIDPQRDDAAPGAHNISVAGAANLGLVRADRAGLGNDDFLHHGLGGTHGIDRIGCLVRGQTDDGLYAGLNGSGQYVVRADDVGSNGLHGEKLAGWNLLQSSRMENVVHAVHSVLHRGNIPDIADKELNLTKGLRIPCLKFMAHVILFFFVPGKHTNLCNVRIQEPVQNRISEGAGSAGNHQGFARKNAHRISIPFFVAYGAPGRFFAAIMFCQSRMDRKSWVYCRVQPSRVYFFR